MRNKLRRLSLLFAVLCLCLPSAHAHPMGNFSINHYSEIRVDAGKIELTYLIDEAEIPTYQILQENTLVAQASDPSIAPYLKQQAAALASHLTLAVNGQTLHLELETENVIFPPGAGGLPTMKMGFVYAARRPAASASPLRVVFRDDNFPGHSGWKEIVIRSGPGVTLEGSSAFSTDRSGQLSNYPTDLLNSPPQDLQAEFVADVKAAIPVADGVITPHHPVLRPKPYSEPRSTAPMQQHRPVTQPSPSGPSTIARPEKPSEANLILRPNAIATPRSRFTQLLSAPKVGFWFLLTSALIAAGLGALHALEPGHGKTIVAAYLVGSRGTSRHAVILGLLVTAAHTFGVYLLGFLVLFAARYVVPEQLYPWLNVASGVIIIGLAGYMLLRACAGSLANEEAPGHTHWYQRLGKRKVSAEVEPTAISMKQLLTLGIMGGIIPCPAALVVLLGAAALHRLVFGFFLIVAFSSGLALVLVAIGLMMVQARNRVSRLTGTGAWAGRWLPVISASAMLIAGIGIALTGFLGTGLQGNLALLFHHRLASFLAIGGLGLFLGMRHSTDPDHVVAVSTIVSRERSVKQGAVIGMLWGFGHTITIFLVGSAIILFGLTIPPRLGLSMEFAVAGMLIFLGILNLTGVLPWLTQKLETARPPGSIAERKDSMPKFSRAGASRLINRFGYYHLIRPLLIGLVHGLAGSAAVALLVLSTIRNPVWSIAYLLLFGFGTVLGMMIMTTFMAVPIALTGKKTGHWISIASGVFSVAFGVFLAYHIGFIDGLFTTHAHWTPQ